jgi:hypothetical protein
MFPGSGYPSTFDAADRASLDGQRAYRRLIQLELTLLVAGAALGTLGAFVSGLGPVVPVFAAAAFLLATGLKLINREREYDRQWFDGRAVAETTKALTWQYVMRVPPFEGDDADRRFVAQLLAAVEARPRVVQAMAAIEPGEPQITRSMRELRVADVATRRAVYRETRLADQVRWYRGRSLHHRARATRWFWLSLAAEVAGIAVALASLAISSIGQWNLLSLVAAIATAATAWSQLNRHDELSKAYALAFHELLLIDGLAETATTEEELAQVVQQGEGAISREHTMWMAKASHTERAAEARPATA